MGKHHGVDVHTLVYTIDSTTDLKQQ